MAFVFKSSRDDPHSRSNPMLGPGRYIGHKDYRFEPAFAPFSSNCPRKKDEVISSTPGPGTYRSPSSIVQSELNPIKVTKSSFVSKVRRFESKNKDEVPGPGSYDVEQRTASQSGLKIKNDSTVALLKMQSPPSIPSHNNVFGYEEASHGMLIKQTNPDIIFAGEKGDTIGPGHYNIPSSFKKNNLH